MEEPTELICRSPIDGAVVARRPLATPEQVHAAIEHARAAQRAWHAVPLAARIETVARFVDAMCARKSELARELTLMMGRCVVRRARPLPSHPPAGQRSIAVRRPEWRPARDSG